MLGYQWTPRHTCFMSSSDFDEWQSSAFGDRTGLKYNVNYNWFYATTSQDQYLHNLVKLSAGSLFGPGHRQVPWYSDASERKWLKKID